MMGSARFLSRPGLLQDNVEKYDNASRYKQRSQLLKMKAGRFVDIAPEIAAPLQVAESSRGAVFGDLNNDGRMDVVMLNARAKPTISAGRSPFMTSAESSVSMCSMREARADEGDSITGRPLLEAQCDIIRHFFRRAPHG